MADSELIVRLRGENSDLKAKLAEVTNASKGTATGMDSVFKSALGSIASAIGVTFSVAAIVNFGKESVKAFSESQAAAVSLANTVSNMGGSSGLASGIQSMVDSMERMSGFDDTDISNAFRDLYIQTGDSAKATEALNVAMDMAAIEHTTVASAATNVHNVMLGLSRTMKNYGMTVREGATDMDYLTELGKKMQGGLSTNLDTVDGKVRKLQTSWENLKEAIGGGIAIDMTTGGLIGMLEHWATNINFDTFLKEGIQKGTMDAASATKLADMGRKYGDAWKQGMMEGAFGSSNSTAPWYATIAGQLEHGATPAPTIPSTNGGANADTWKAAWSSINMIGGNLPELTKYIGNLRQASTIKQKVTVDVEMTVNGGMLTVKNATPVANAIAKAIAPAVQQAVTHGQGWQPPKVGLGAGFQFGGN